LGRLRDVNDASGLHFNNPVCNEFNEMRQQFLNCSLRFQEFDPNRKMLAADPWRALRMKTMMDTKASMPAQNRGSGDAVREEKGDYLQVKIVSLGSSVLIEMNYDPLGGSRRKHATAVLGGSTLTR
jgi:hypothetical protein